MIRKKVVKVFGVVAAVVFLLIQFIQPNRSNPPVDPAMTINAELNIPSHVASLLNRACKDCHSNETHWPFYSYVAPASWLVSDDVMEGRKHFNMSEWGKYKMGKKIQKLSGIYEAISDKSMPLPKYVYLHPEANFSQAERDTLIQWAKREGEKLLGDEEP